MGGPVTFGRGGGKAGFRLEKPQASGYGYPAFAMKPDEQQLSLFGDAPQRDSAAGADASRPLAAPVARPVAPPTPPAPPAPPKGGDSGPGGPGGEDTPLRRLMDDNFLQYASYVIKDRAIPDIDDGLKPVQRRILHTLNEMDDGRFIKVANVVGQTMKYHPHGDASIGDALVVLVNRGYLIEGQGNFGNIHTGDRAAAPRYIECRLTDLAATQLFNKDLTEFVPSYDGRNKEPVVLPSKLPLLLMLGADGIAVGLSTCILPHNFTELLQAQIAILQKKPFTLLPDFQQGGLMDIRDYDEGCGRIRLRAVIDQKDESTLVVRELPYGVTTESLIDSIEDAAKKGKIKIRPNGIRDYTSGHVEIEIALPSDANIAKTLQSLYAFTKCEVALALHPVVIRDQRPVEMSVHEILRHNTKRLVELLRKELQIERHKIDEALQAASLVRLFIVHRIYKRIEECPTAAAVREAVLDGLAPYRDQLRRDITAADLDMLLAIPIRRISLYDINKSRKEEDNLLADFAEVEKNLADVTNYTIRYLRNLLRDYSGLYPRRTRVQTFDAIEMRELTATRLEIFHDREKGYIGHKDVAGEAPALVCSSLDKLVVVWDDGRYKVVPPPEKLFVDKNVIYLGIYDRDRVFTMVYVADPIAHLKRFRLGGIIQNKEYTCTPEGASKILFFADDDPPILYVKYAPRKGQQIHQQEFQTAKAAIRTPKTRGLQMTTKRITLVTPQRPRNWDAKPSPRGAFLPG